MSKLTELLMALKTRRAPAFLKTATQAVEDHYQSFLTALQTRDGPLYGVSVLTGHLAERPQESLSPADLEEAIFSSHAIGGEPWFDAETAAAITLAKACDIAALGPLASGAIYAAILDAFEDRAFNPNIPSQASYSSGDVIPATHWAVAMLARARVDAPTPLGPGEAMALINGAFVHFGAALALTSQIREHWKILLGVSAKSLARLDADRRAVRASNGARPWARDSVAFVAARLEPSSAGRVQDPVSVRSTAASLEASCAAIEAFLDRLERQAGEPSGNPLFLDGEIVPSGTFLDPELSIATSGLIETFLMQAWLSVRRQNHLLDSRRSDPLAPHQDDEARLIQMPKLAMARLEFARATYGQRSFTIGGATSYGVEDFWSHGLAQTVAAREAMAVLTEILAIEAMICDALEGAAANGIGPDARTAAIAVVASASEAAPFPV